MWLDTRNTVYIKAISSIGLLAYNAMHELKKLHECSLTEAVTGLLLYKLVVYIQVKLIIEKEKGSGLCTSDAIYTECK